MQWYESVHSSCSGEIFDDLQLEVDLLSLLYENLSRFDESIESDRAGVYHILGETP